MTVPAAVGGTPGDRVRIGQFEQMDLSAADLEPGAGEAEIREGLNVAEDWNSADGFIFYGKNGEIATNVELDLAKRLLLAAACSRTERPGQLSIN